MVQKQILTLSVGCLGSLLWNHRPQLAVHLTVRASAGCFWITGRVDWTGKMSGNAFFQRSERILTAKHLNGPLEDSTFSMLSKCM